MIIHSAEPIVASTSGSRNRVFTPVEANPLLASPSPEISIMLLTFALVAALAAPADSVSGTWLIKGEVAGNPLESTCTLVVADAKISGSCKNAEGKENGVTGEVKEGKVVFEHGGDYNGQDLKIIYTATLPSAKEMKGTIEVKPFDVGGEFTATPVAAPAPAK
jgi:hypothetical protein